MYSLYTSTQALFDIVPFVFCAMLGFLRRLLKPSANIMWERCLSIRHMICYIKFATLDDLLFH
jgi:hypothetical protein